MTSIRSTLNARFATRGLAVLIFSLAVLLSAGALSAKNGDLLVGTCMRDITPISPALAPAYEAQFGTPAAVNHSDPIFLAGFGNDRRATGYNDRLWARGVVLDGRGGRVALVALDLVGYFVNDTQIVCRRHQRLSFISKLIYQLYQPGL